MDKQNTPVVIVSTGLTAFWNPLLRQRARAPLVPNMNEAEVFGNWATSYEHSQRLVCPVKSYERSHRLVCPVTSFEHSQCLVCPVLISIHHSENSGSKIRLEITGDFEIPSYLFLDLCFNLFYSLNKICFENR